jgi:tetratricopeptide (TPR) repeat protein
MKSKIVLVAAIVAGAVLGCGGTALAFGISKNHRHDGKSTVHSLDEEALGIIRTFIADGDYRDAGVLLANAMSLFPEDDRLPALWTTLSNDLDLERNREGEAAKNWTLTKDDYRSLASMLARNQRTMDVMAQRISEIERKGSSYAPIDRILDAGTAQTLPDIGDVSETGSAEGGDKLMAAGKYAQAYDVYYSLCAKNPNDGKALIGAAKALMAMPSAQGGEQQKKTVAFLERAAKLAPAEREPKMLLKAAYYRLGEYQKSEEWLTGALKIEKGEYDNWLEAGNICVEMGNFSLADERFASAVACDPHRADAYVARAEATIKLRRAQDAQGYARKSLEIEPMNERASVCLAQALFMGSEVKAAADAYAKAFSAFGKVEYASNASSLYLDCGAYEAAARAAKSGLAKNRRLSKADREMAASAYGDYAAALIGLKKPAKEILSVIRDGIAACGPDERLAIFFADTMDEAGLAKEAYDYLLAAAPTGGSDSLNERLERLAEKYPELKGKN